MSTTQQQQPHPPPAVLQDSSSSRPLSPSIMSSSSNSTTTSNNHTGVVIGPPRPCAMEMEILSKGLNSTDSSEQLSAARSLRVMLSSEREYLIKQVVERGWTPKLMAWLSQRDQPSLQIEALWALTNIAAGGGSENTGVLLHHGVVPTLVNLLDSDNHEVLEQAVWVLGNLAGEGPVTRDLILSANALPGLMTVLKRTDAKLSLLRIATWTLSNLCDGQPRPVIQINTILADMANVLSTFEDTEILSHTCWALSHLCDGPSVHISSVVSSDVCKRLVSLLGHPCWRITKPALRAIGNIVCAEDDHDYTQHIIDCKAVPVLKTLIGHTNREIQKEACWTLSNIAAGTVEQIQAVLDSDAIPALIALTSEGKNNELSSSSCDNEVKSEACWVVLNATSCGSDTQIEYLVSHGCIAVIRNLLQEASMIMMALEGLERILQVGEMLAKRRNNNGTNPYASEIAKINFEMLKKSKTLAVSKKSGRLWEEHFIQCMICEKHYSKQSGDYAFCDECKCNVCLNCDCTKFHYSYQASIWSDEVEKKSAEEQAKKAKKKGKRQRKRERTKEKKAALNKSKSSNSNARNDVIISDDEDFDEGSSAAAVKSEDNGVRSRKAADETTTASLSSKEVSTPKSGEIKPERIEQELAHLDQLSVALNDSGSILDLYSQLGREGEEEDEEDFSWMIPEEDRKKYERQKESSV